VIGLVIFHITFHIVLPSKGLQEVFLALTKCIQGLCLPSGYSSAFPQCVIKELVPNNELY
jgi:hypothetical protein